MNTIRDLMQGRDHLRLVWFEHDDGGEFWLEVRWHFTPEIDPLQAFPQWPSGFLVVARLNDFARLEIWEPVEALEHCVQEYIDTVGMEWLQNYEARKLMAEFRDRIGGCLA